MDRGPAPQGLQSSAQGFNPGNPQNKRFAMKGREMRVPDEARTHTAQKSERAIGMCSIGPSDPASILLGRSIRRPLQGASLLVNDSQGRNGRNLG
jgi:hypothetical protein